MASNVTWNLYFTALSSHNHAVSFSVIILDTDPTNVSAMMWISFCFRFLQEFSEAFRVLL